MSMRRVLWIPCVALAAGLGGPSALRAEEPTDPIPQVARDRYVEAQDLDKAGKTREAVAAYEQAIQLGMKEYPRVYLKEAAACARLGDYKTAAAKYSVVLDVLGLEGSCRD